MKRIGLACLTLAVALVVELIASSGPAGASVKGRKLTADVSESPPVQLLTLRL